MQIRNGVARCTIIHWVEAPRVQGSAGVAFAPRERREPGHRKPIESNCSAADAHWLKAPAGRPGFGFCSSVCPGRARNTAHSSSRGGRLGSCRGSSRYEWEPFAPGPGCRGPRAAWGPTGTMARPGPTVAEAEAGAAADGQGRGTGAKLGTKGPFSWLAGGCLHRCGSGRAAEPRAGVGGASLPAAPGVAGESGVSSEARYRL